MLSVASQDESITKLKASSDEREKLLRTQLHDLQLKSKERINELTLQIDQLQTEMTRKTSELDKLTTSLQAINKLKDEHKITLDQVRLDLENEIAQNQVYIYIYIYYKYVY